MPATTLSADDLTGGAIYIADLMVKCALAPSKGEAKRLVQQGGVDVNGVKVNTFTKTFAADELSGDGLVIKKGKKVFHRALLG